MNKNIIYVSGLFMPAFGGAEISMFTLLQLLSKIGFTITVVTKKLDNETYKDDYGRNFIVYRIESQYQIEKILKEICSELKSNFVIFTQNSWIKQSILYGKKYNIPVFLFLRSPAGDIDVKQGGKLECTHIVANSNSTLQYAIEKYERKDTILVPSFVNQDDYKVKNNSKEFITMVNPIKSKGGLILKKIAQSLPNEKFLVVKGWSHLKKEGKWNEELIKELSDGHGLSEAEEYFEEVSFEDNMNVKVIDSVGDMRKVYSKTKILLIPSISKEGGPRVATEAMINGIPIIASSNANLEELLKECGTIIYDFFNIINWKSTIQNLLNEKQYKMLSKLTYLKASRLDQPTKLAAPLLKILTKYFK